MDQDEELDICQNGECHRIVFSLFIFAESKPLQFHLQIN